jgi:hypothetical protein
MRIVKLPNISSTQSDVIIPISGVYGEGFNAGDQVVLQVCRTTNWDSGNVRIETDNRVDADGNALWTDIRSAASINSNVHPELLGSPQMGDNLRINVAAYVAGVLVIYLMNDR